ncbi:hypothetical protein WJ438_37630 [Streptomyces sp. GD-15H]|uniref:hypothetical protein n=1 Tax=Streptomyces sp. GD-15H TaxID=3129112 RepID=UPI00325178B9
MGDRAVTGARAAGTLAVHDRRVGPGWIASQQVGRQVRWTTRRIVAQLGAIRTANAVVVRAPSRARVSCGA